MIVEFISANCSVADVFRWIDNFDITGINIAQIVDKWQNTDLYNTLTGESTHLPTRNADPSIVTRITHAGQKPEKRCRSGSKIILAFMLFYSLRLHISLWVYQFTCTVPTFTVPTKVKRQTSWGTAFQAKEGAIKVVFYDFGQSRLSNERHGFQSVEFPLVHSKLSTEAIECKNRDETAR